MALSSFRWSESWRVLAYSAVAALAFFALERLEFALFDLVGADRLLALTRGKAADDRLAAEALDLAERSRRTAALPSGHRLAAFRLGYEIGWASEYAGSFAMSEARIQAQAAQVADAHVAFGREQARRIGIDATGVAALPSRTLTDFARLQDRFEADENGIAARVEQRLTPIHRHLYLLGVHVGAESAKVESNGGTFALPAAALIRRHATLAGIAPALWQPLAADASGESTAQVLERYRAALNALGADLATRDANDARHPSTTAAEPPR
jgi:hypothetical protein